MSAGVIACFCMANATAARLARQNAERQAQQAQTRRQQAAHAHDPSGGCPDEPELYDPARQTATGR